MNSVNKTLYIPLYGKAYVSKKGIILHDSRAEYIWEKEGFKLKGKFKLLFGHKKVYYIELPDEEEEENTYF